MADAMTVLKSLTFTTLPPKPSVNPTLDRRNKIIARLEEQKRLSVRSWKKDEVGEKTVMEKKQRVLP